MKRREVVIVGGGPGGACSALALLGAGHRVRIFEMHKEIVASPCGEAAPRIALDLLERVTGFDSDPFIRHVPDDGRLVFPNGSTTTLIRDMVVLDRVAWQRGLIDAVRKSGGEITLGARVKRIRPRRSELKIAGRRRETFAICIDASGPRSHLVKVPDRLVCTQITVRGSAPPDGNLRFILDKRFSAHGAWLFPHGDGYHLGLVGKARALRKLQKHLDLGDHRGTLAAAPIPVGGERFAEGNVLAIGDSAGMAAAVHGGGLFPIIAGLGALVDAVTSGDLSTYQEGLRQVTDVPAQKAAVEALYSFTNPELDRLATVLAGQDLSPPAGPSPDVLGAVERLGSIGRRFQVFLRGFVGPPPAAAAPSLIQSPRLSP